jgi:aspartate kinase
MIIQNQGADGTTDITFTVHKNEMNKALEILRNKVQPLIHAREIKGDGNIAKISVVGVGMRSHVGVASQMFRTLSEEGINIQMISTSEIKIAVVIEEKYMELAVRALHQAFELEEA